MKRIIILAVAICLVVSSLTVFAQGSLTIKPLTNTIENSLFTDTNENDWYYPHLEMLTNNKGIDGYPDGTFRPENNMSNAEFIKIVVALVSGELPKGSADGTHWADNYMNKAVELGLITQDENVVDRYDDPIIRQNMAKVVSRTMEKVFKEEKVADTSAYISKIVDWDGTCRLCKDDIAQAYAKGIIIGMPDGSFAGLKNATRAEATTMIVRLIDSSYRVKVIGNVVFNEKTDITVDGRMKAEKSKNYMDITLENLEFYKENEKYYVKCTFPELPQGFENWLTIGIERKNDSVITLTNGFTMIDEQKISSVGSFTKELVGMKSTDEINYIHVQIGVEAKENLKTNSRTGHYNILSTKPNQITFIKQDGTQNEYFEYDFKQLFKW